MYLLTSALRPLRQQDRSAKGLPQVHQNFIFLLRSYKLSKRSSNANGHGLVLNGTPPCCVGFTPSTTCCPRQNCAWVSKRLRQMAKACSIESGHSKSTLKQSLPTCCVVMTDGGTASIAKSEANTSSVPLVRFAEHEKLNASHTSVTS